MNAKKFGGFLLPAIFLLVGTAAFAAEKAPLRLLDPVTVNGKALPAGDYSVTWEGSGPSVEIKILKGKEVVVTAPAQLSNLPRAANGSSVSTKTNAGGAPSLTQITFGGKKYSLILGEQGVQSAENSK
ncbi:MAG TPA: hypothetical protein VGF06_12790 [Terriglobales bacterium]|jgi:hypothetical protein